MIKLFLSGLSLLFVFQSFCQSSAEKEIDEFITSWHDAAAANNQDKYFSMIDEKGIYIGTDSTEIWSRDEFYDWSTPHFNNNKGWSFTANSRNIYFEESSSIAWFDELLDYGKGTLRGSGVLIKRGNDWKIIHYVLSLPVPNEKYKEVMKVINSKSEISEREE
ncbi:MAG: nuclear transport factor 2 family protein [Bacteroidales bacterium]|nr:nuclear transport factor 2 family protein [Bacteroidales bacterium]MCF8405123.1 nuclear transport factor 2 family protein [Bacteroidales bacterium]